MYGMERVLDKLGYFGVVCSKMNFLIHTTVMPNCCQFTAISPAVGLAQNRTDALRSDCSYTLPVESSACSNSDGVISGKYERAIPKW